MTCVVRTDNKPATLLCTVCKGKHPLPLPLAISQMVELIRKFQGEHALCRGKHPVRKDKP